METLGSRLKRLRQEHGLAQHELAAALGVARASLASWEIGRREPDNATLVRIADHFGVSLDWLLGRTDVKGSVGVQMSEDRSTKELLDTVESLPPEAQKDLRRYAEFLRVREALSETDRQKSATSTSGG